jgi:hypothetical protein
MNNLKEYLQNNQKNPSKELRLGSATVYVKEELLPTIDLNKILDFVTKTLPSQFLENIEMVYIGNFPFLKVKEVDAIFENGAIYISNKVENEHELISDLIHEIAHSFEEIHPEELYSDGLIEEEFLAKRERLFMTLKTRGYQVDRTDFLNIEYDRKFDNFLYNEVGYEQLGGMTNGLFISPYAATSLREYFANAFEEFFVNDMNTVKKNSPTVFQKIINYLEF